MWRWEKRQPKPSSGGAARQRRNRRNLAADVAIKGGRIAAVGDVAYTKGPSTRIIDATGRFITPGLVEGHLHQYHSYLGVTEFVEALLSHGVTATADAFYGPGIVAGVPAVRFFKEAFERMPMRLIFLVPTLSWLQNRELGLTPTPGIAADELKEILGWEGCYGLEEPPYLPVVEHFPEFLDLFDETLRQRKVITGHAAGITWRQFRRTPPSASRQTTSRWRSMTRSPKLAQE